MYYKFACVLVLAVVAAAFVAAPAEARKKPAVDATKIPIGDVQCSICGFIITAVENWIQSNTTEQEIMQYLEKLCGYMGNFKDTCSSFVYSEIPAIIQLIISKAPPAVVCTRWCNGSSNAVDMNMLKSLNLNRDIKPVEKGSRVKPAACPACPIAAEVLTRVRQQFDVLRVASVAPLFRQQCAATLGDQNQCLTFEKAQLGAMLNHVAQGKTASSYCAQAAC